MASMDKKLINGVDRCVDDALFGVTTLNTDVVQLRGYKVVVRRDLSKLAGKVAILSGGGSGHEPTHAGYIGAGMLTGAIAGDVFTSPPPESILAAIKTIAKGHPIGTLLVVKNYTGDRLNFGLAMERVKAQGNKIDMVVVGEDCALTSKDKSAGRRGLAGTLFVHKIMGAMSECGSSLEDMVKVTKEVTKSMGTIGLSLGSCTVPGMKPSFQLGPDEVELGLGIHGEAGVRRMKLLSAADTVSIMLQHMTNPESVTKMDLEKGGRIALMVNNLGGCTVLELNIIAGEAINQLENLGVIVALAFAGSFITSLEMPGISLTILKLTPDLEKYLTAPTTAPAWPEVNIVNTLRSS